MMRARPAATEGEMALIDAVARGDARTARRLLCDDHVDPMVSDPDSGSTVRRLGLVVYNVEMIPRYRDARFNITPMPRPTRTPRPLSPMPPSLQTPTPTQCLNA